MNNHAGKKSLKICDTAFASGEDGATKNRFTHLSKTRRRRQNIPNNDSEISKGRKCCDVISERWETEDETKNYRNLSLSKNFQAMMQEGKPR